MQTQLKLKDNKIINIYVKTDYLGDCPSTVTVLFENDNFYKIDTIDPTGKLAFLLMINLDRYYHRSVKKEVFIANFEKYIKNIEKRTKNIGDPWDPEWIIEEN